MSNPYRKLSTSGKMKLFGALLTASALALTGCAAQGTAPAAAQEQLLKVVKTTEVGTASWESAATQVADILPSLQLDVVLKTDGDVLQVVRKKGDLVREGDVIAVLDSVDVQRQVEKASYSLQSAEEQLSKAKKDLADSQNELSGSLTKAQDALMEAQKEYDKLRNDYDVGEATERQLETAETNLKAARIDIDTLKRKKETLDTTNSVSALELQLKASQIAAADADKALENFTVKAPADGLLTEMIAEEGMTLSRGTKIGVLQKQEKVKLKAELTDAAYKAVQGKSELPFTVSGSNETHTARITYLSRVANTTTKTFSLELEADNKGGSLLPGGRVQLNLTSANDQQTVAVPSASVIRENGEAYVFVLSGDQAEKRKVTIGRTKDNRFEITDGLKSGEKLIVVGQSQLKDGEQVKAQQ
ncbi:efflux RND transporter periplasmic adaptor subunit [Paenibacillus sp. y28]|uniref:efflux RND transporter periplasmic adaptor subunit n=1 Tax=Paenibacillus sp. y28 TaxID=3129110 RepID=UPI003019C8FC